MLSLKKYKKAKLKWFKNFKYFCIVDISGNYIERGLDDNYEKEFKTIKIDEEMSPTKKVLFFSLYNDTLFNAVFYAVKVFLKIKDNSIKFSFIGKKPIKSVERKLNKQKKLFRKELERQKEKENLEILNLYGR